MPTTAGTVKRIDLEGGFFGIIAEDGGQLYPVDLPAEHEQDGLRIRFRYEPVSVFTVHQWGRSVSVHDVEREG